MLNLPKSTECNARLPKNAIYTKYQVIHAKKVEIDSCITKLTIINELSQATLKIEAGKNIKSIYLVYVHLKESNIEENKLKKALTLLSKLINQKVIFLIEDNRKARLALFHKEFFQTDWKVIEELNININALNLEILWENIVKSIANIESKENSSLEESISVNTQKEKLQKEIARLDKKARTEKQSHKKQELASQVKKLKQELEDL